MKKLTAISTIFIIFGCHHDHGHDYNDPNKHGQHHFKRVKSKFSTYVKPSESMKVGLKKHHRTHDYSNHDYSNDNYHEDDHFEEPYSTPMAESMNNQHYKGYFKVGKPYAIYGITYTPQDYQEYDKIGTSSWYGEAFHGKKTANGEIYNLNDMTAAHKTLPLPSLVRVTNLNNGKSIVLRVNDRGPFAKNRIIDVSKKAATILGFKEQGTTTVRVQLLRKETNELLYKLKINH